uniref:phenylalanine--tRNA ligase n=1 Tax=Syphacia muris TaxID=451379 RepID=A0A0N5ATX0_9BILA
KTSLPSKYYKFNTNFYTELTVDEKWNISNFVLKLLERRLLVEENNPLRLLKEAIANHFNSEYVKAGSPLYTICEKEPRAVTVWENFDSLLTPLDHVSRKPSDTYYINKNYCLRSHTTAHENKLITQGLECFLTFGDVYRRDEINRTHFPCFHQLEGVHLFSKSELFSSQHSSKNLFANGTRTQVHQETHSPEAAEKTLEKLCIYLFGPTIETRWVDCYFPFTHPSFELEVFYEGKWMEVLGCGILEQKILNNCKASDKVGFAFGLGLERLGMVLYGIPDIRLFWSRDSGFLSQFKGKSFNDRFKYAPISIHPQVYFDLSFWLPSNINPEVMIANTYDAIRSIGGSNVEQVKITDCFKSKKDNRLSQTFRIVYRSYTKALTKDECNLIHKKTEQYLAEKYHVQIR